MWILDDVVKRLSKGSSTKPASPKQKKMKMMRMRMMTGEDLVM